MLWDKWCCHVLVVCDTVVRSYGGGYQITKEKMTINEIEILEDHFYIPSVWLMTLWRRLWHYQLLLLALRRLLLLTSCLHHHQCSSSAAVVAALLMPYRSSLSLSV